MFLLFQTVTEEQWKKVRILSWCVTLAALAMYTLTARHSAFPGASAQWIAWVAGADVRDVVTHPLLTKLGGWAAAFSVGGLAARLNLLAAIAAAFTVGWIFNITHFITFEWMREESAVLHASKIARFAGFAAALAVASAVPFWQAATQFRPEIFDAALAVGCLNLLVVYAYSENFLWLLLFGALTGVGFAESASFAMAAPFLWLFAVIVEWKLAWCRTLPLLLALVLSLLCVIGVYLYAGTLTFQAESMAPGFLNLLRDVLPVLREQWKEAQQFFLMRLWLPVLLLGYGAAVIAAFAAMRMLDNLRGWSLFVLGFALSAAEIIMLFDFAFTPCAVMMAKGILPALTYAAAGIGFGLFLASLRAYSVLDDPAEAVLQNENAEDEDDEEEGAEDRKKQRTVKRGSDTGNQPGIWKVTRLFGFIMVPILGSLLIVSAVLHVRRVFSEKISFADQAAEETLDRLGQRQWMVSNGLLDSHFLTRALERKQPLHLLCPYRIREKRYLKRIGEAIQADSSFSQNTKLRSGNLLDVNFHLFLEDFFASDPGLGAKVVTFGVPDLWYSASWVPVPDHFFFQGMHDLKAFSAESVFKEQRDFWTRWKSFFEAKDGDERQISHMTRVTLRRHLALLANNLGVVMDDMKQPESAYQCYRQAMEIVPDHISALLNLFELVSRGIHPEDKDRIGNNLKKKVTDPHERYPLWALSRYYGYVRNYELFIRMGWSWALSSSPESVLAGLRSTYAIEPDEEKRVALSALMAPLYAMRGDFAKSETEYRETLAANPANDFAVSGLTRLALQRNQLAEARTILEKGESSGASKAKLRLDWAALSLASGDLPRARILLEQVCDEQDAPPMALGMLAMVMLEQKDIMPVERKVLPSLVQKLKGTNNYFVQVVQGRVAQVKGGKEGISNARACFLRALSMRPDVQPLLKTILSLDVLLKDKKYTLAHALALLRAAPSDPYANFVIGTIRLEDGEYGDAEEYLKKSCANEKTASLPALNNYAQVLCRIKRLDEAENAARRAVEKAKDRYETWSTLAFVLAQEGKLDGAAEAIKKAWDLNAKDTRLYLTEALIAVKRHDAATAQKAMDAIGDMTEYSVSDRREAANLRVLISQMKK